MQTSEDRWAAEHELSAMTRGGEDARPQSPTRVSIPKAPVVDYSGTNDAELALRLTVDALDSLDVVSRSQTEFAEVLLELADGLVEIQRTVLDGQKALSAELHALRPIEKQAPEPEVDPLQSIDNVLGGLVLIVDKIDQLRDAMDKRDSATSTITFDSNGQPSKISRSDGSEIVIERDRNRRQIRLRGR